MGDKEAFSSLRGFYDILPEDACKWSYVESVTRDVFFDFGFKEIRTPILEKASLFKRSIGDTTDIVEKEMYTFSDRKGEILAMRPEGTAPCVRAYIEHKLYSKGGVARLYYIGPMFRYERPQKGRQRQFHQIGAELFGSKDPFADAEIIDLSYTILKRLGIDDVLVEINSLGCKNCRSHFKEILKEFLLKNRDRLCSDCLLRMERNPLRVLDCKRDAHIVKEAPSILDVLCDECRIYLDKLMDALSSTSIPFVPNPKIVRGLDYYTGVVFEITSKHLGAQNAVCAGGRYDDLVSSLGGPCVPACGFAAGLERVLLLAECGRVSKDPFIFGVHIGYEAKRKVFCIIEDLRKNGIPSIMIPDDLSIKAQLRNANRERARYALIVGEDEMSESKVILKDLVIGTQESLPMELVKEEIEKRFKIYKDGSFEVLKNG